MRSFLRTPLLVAIVALLFSTLPSRGLSGPDSKDGVITIARVFTGWKEGSSFKRISEYFNGRENTGDTTVLRTHPEQRSGFYFLVRVLNSAAPTSVKITIELVTPTDTKPKTYTFATELKGGTTVLNLGLTADDWPDDKANPVAWKIDFIGSDDRVLASEKSYLWERPNAK